MYISIEKAELTISAQEARDIYRSVRKAIESDIQTHWRRHPDCFPKDEQPRLSIMKELSRMTCDNYEYDLLQLTKLLKNDE